MRSPNSHGTIYRTYTVTEAVVVLTSVKDKDFRKEIPFRNLLGAFDKDTIKFEFIKNSGMIAPDYQPLSDYKIEVTDVHYYERRYFLSAPIIIANGTVTDEKEIQHPQFEERVGIQ